MTVEWSWNEEKKFDEGTLETYVRDDPLTQKIWEGIDLPGFYETFIKIPERPTIEIPPEIKSADNSEVLKQMARNFLTDTDSFMVWEQEARNRGISPMQYLEAGATAAVLTILAVYGVGAGLSLLQTSPTLQKVAKPLIQAFNKIGGFEAAKISQPQLIGGKLVKGIPMYAGLPADRALQSLAQQQTGLKTVGELQKALFDITPGFPGVINKLVSIATEKNVLRHDVESAFAGLEKVGKTPEILGYNKELFATIDKVTEFFKVPVEGSAAARALAIEAKIVGVPKVGETLWGEVREGILQVDREITAANVERVYGYWDYLRKTKDMDKEEKTAMEVEFIKDLLSRKDNEVVKAVLKRITGPGRGKLAKEVSVLLKDWDKVDIPAVETKVGEAVETAYKAIKETPEIAPKVNWIADNAVDILKRSRKELGEKTYFLSDILTEEGKQKFPHAKDIVIVQDATQPPTSAVFKTVSDEEASRLNIPKKFILFGEDALPEAIVHEAVHAEREALGRDMAPELAEPSAERAALWYRKISPEAEVEDSAVYQDDLMKEIGITPPALPKPPGFEALPPPGAPPTEEAIPLPGAKPPLPGVAVPPRYTARKVDTFSPEVALGRPLTDKEIKILEISGPAENRLGWRWYGSYMRNWGQGYEERSGFPVYTEGIYPALQAGHKASRYRADVYTVLKGWEKELSAEEITDLDKHLKYTQAIYELETFAEPTDEVVETLKLYHQILDDVNTRMNTTMLEIGEGYRNLMDYMFDYSKGDPEKYLKHYVSLIEDKKTKEKVKREFWSLYIRNKEPWFMKERKSIGRVSMDYHFIDLARFYADASAFKRYEDELAPLESIAKKLPGTVTDHASPYYKVNNWIKWLKTGTPESGLGKFSEAAREKLDVAMTKVFGWTIPKDVNLGRMIVNGIYFGTMAFNPSPPLKNLSQLSHDITDMPVQDIIAGLIWMQTEEAKHMFKESGVLAGFSPFLQRQHNLKPGASKFRKAIYYGQEIPLRTGLLPFAGVDVLNREGIWPAEMVRVIYWGEKYIKGEVDWDTYARKTDFEGMHPCVSRGVRGMIEQDKMDWENYKKGVGKEPQLPNLDRARGLLAYERTLTAQYGYQKENRPWLGRQGGVGAAGFQFLSWPIGKIEQQADILGAAQRLFKAGKKQPAYYQLWKESKNVLYWVVLAMVATGAGIEGKKLARQWGLGWIPTGFGPAVDEASAIVESVTATITGYKWKARPLEEVAEDYLSLFDPTARWRRRYKKQEKYETAYEKTLTMLGLPMPKRGEYGVDLFEQWLHGQKPVPKTFEEWIGE